MLLPTERPVTQSWAMEFYDFNGTYYPQGFYHSLGWNGHNGIDFGCWTGDPVRAICDGIIEYVGPGNNHPLLTGGGNTILLRNDALGVRFEYLHLSQQNVYTGQRVSAGDVIGLSGSSGAATAPHLHLGAIPVGPVDQNDGWRGRIDPTPYLYGTLAAQGTIGPSQEDDVITPDDIKAIKDAIIWGKVPKYNAQGQEIGTTTLGESVAWQESNFYLGRKLTLDAIKETVLGVLTTAVPNVATKGTTNLATELSWLPANFKRANDAVVDLDALAESIAAAVDKLTADKPKGTA